MFTAYDRQKNAASSAGRYRGDAGCQLCPDLNPWSLLMQALIFYLVVIYGWQRDKRCFIRPVYGEVTA